MITNIQSEWERERASSRDYLKRFRCVEGYTDQLLERNREEEYACMWAAAAAAEVGTSTNTYQLPCLLYLLLYIPFVCTTRQI